MAQAQEFEVRAQAPDMIEIVQMDPSFEEMRIMLHMDQIPLLVKWLEETARALETQNE